MLITEPDHFVIAARTLKEGVDYIHSKLGVVIPKGGEHPKMGTHNHLMNLGNTFLEIIAINPDQQPQRMPRWYNLDSEQLQKQLSQSPKLITWVVRTNNIEEAASKTSINLGKIEKVSRGNLTWKITVPEDGSLPENGIFPTLIQWPENVKPWENMQNLGYNFLKLQISHPSPQMIAGELSRLSHDNADIEISESKNTTLQLQLINSKQEIIKVT